MDVQSPLVVAVVATLVGAAAGFLFGVASRIVTEFVRHSLSLRRDSEEKARLEESQRRAREWEMRMANIEREWQRQKLSLQEQLREQKEDRDRRRRLATAGPLIHRLYTSSAISGYLEDPDGRRLGVLDGLGSLEDLLQDTERSAQVGTDLFRVFPKKGKFDEVLNWFTDKSIGEVTPDRNAGSIDVHVSPIEGNPWAVK